MNPDCFGLEFVDENKTRCPHIDCELRQLCSDTFEVTRGLRELQIKRNKILKRGRLRYIRRISKQVFDGLRASSPRKFRKRGYRKAHKLAYQECGGARDQFVSAIKQAVEDLGYTFKMAKVLQSVVKSDGTYLFKVRTQHKKNVRLYIPEELSKLFGDTSSLVCAPMNVNEIRYQPDYLEWVVKISNMVELRDFITAVKAFGPEVK